MNPRIFLNPHAAPALDAEPPGLAPLEFHRRLPGYAPTRLADAPGLAQRLGVGAAWVKDESSRFGLPAFKILGMALGTTPTTRVLLIATESTTDPVAYAQIVTR
jgi:diaminopropionate ammonia-lyase